MCSPVQLRSDCLVKIGGSLDIYESLRNWKLIARLIILFFNSVKNMNIEAVAPSFWDSLHYLWFCLLGRGEGGRIVQGSQQYYCVTG